MQTTHRAWLSMGLTAIVVAAAGAWWWFSSPAPQLPLAAPTSESPAVAHVPPTVDTSVPPRAEPVPVPPAEHPLAAEEVSAALAALLGQQKLLALLQLDTFPRNVVATVDNLGRSHAPPMVWPVTPAAGRFLVQQRDGTMVIDADNGARYTPLVLLAEGVPVAQAVNLYVRLYPLLQQAYAELGFPKGQFNDRLLQVIDLLIATPNAPEAIPVQLTEVKGTVPSLRPWVRYEFSDPALQSLVAGQKIMMRVGPVNQRRLKARLVAVRQEILQRARPPAGQP